MSSFIYPDSKTRKIFGKIGKRIAYRLKKLAEAANGKQGKTT